MKHEKDSMLEALMLVLVMISLGAAAGLSCTIGHNR